MGWGRLRLRLPASADQFVSGQYLQQVEVQDACLERSLVDAADTRFLHDPLRLRGRRVLFNHVEVARELLRRVPAAWRGLAWQLQSNPPRLWRT